MKKEETMKKAAVREINVLRITIVGRTARRKMIADERRFLRVPQEDGARLDPPAESKRTV